MAWSPRQQASSQKIVRKDTSLVPPMRFYFPESPKFRFFRQKQDCHALTEVAPVEMGRAAPKGKDDVRQAQEVKQAIAKAPPRPNEGAHRFLDQVDAVHKIKSPEFLNSKPVQDALRHVCSRLREGYGFDVDPQAEFKGDHRCTAIRFRLGDRGQAVFAGLG